MKLNPDCVRDILLICEDICDTTRVCRFECDKNFEFEGRVYSWNEVYYHLKQCQMNDLFSDMSESIIGNVDVHDLSPEGHKFLGNIRQPENWKKTKDICVKSGNIVLSVITSVAEGVTTATIKRLLGAD